MAKWNSGLKRERFSGMSAKGEMGTVERHVARGATPASIKMAKRAGAGGVQEGTGTTVHDERAGGLRAARLGTVEPVPDALDLAATESAITAIFKRGNCVHGESVDKVEMRSVRDAEANPHFAHPFRDVRNRQLQLKADQCS